MPSLSITKYSSSSSRPPTPAGFAFQFQLPTVSPGPRADDPPAEFRQKINSSLTLHHNAYITHFISSHRTGILSSYIITRRASTVQ